MRGGREGNKRSGRGKEVDNWRKERSREGTRMEDYWKGCV